MGWLDWLNTFHDTEKRRNKMKRFVVLMITCLIGATFTTAAFAQSAGSFSATFADAQCSIADSDGKLSGGIQGTSLPDVQVKVPGGSGTALVITPSLVTVLYTQNNITKMIPTDKQNVGLRVNVLVDNSTAGVVPEITKDNPGVIYDQRFISVSAGFLSSITTCLTTCLSIVQSTLSAHTFNFYISNLAPGTHTIKVMWDLIGGGDGVCVGPGTLTVEQVKNFNCNTGISL